MKSLLLISESFPPLNNIAAQRFPPMLKVLEENGWQVWVVTQNSSGDLPVPVPEAQIIRIGCHHQPDARVTAGSRFAARSSVNAAVHGAIQNVAGIKLHIVNSTLVSWYRPVKRALPVWRQRLQASPDVVLGTHASPAALWLARRLAAEFGTPWIADFRDLAALRPAGRSAYACWLDRRIEARLLRSAAAVTTCGEDWAKMLRTAYHRPTRVLYNGFDHTLLTASDPARPPDLPQGPFLYYAGRFYERQMTAVERLLEAVRDTPFQVVVRSLGPPEREAAIRAHAQACGVAGQLDLRPPVPLAQVAAEAAHASANLVLETIGSAEDWTRGHLSGKFLQLIPQPPPVVYVGRADAEAGDILRRTGRGLLCTTTDEIRRALGRLAAGERWPGDPDAVEDYAKARQGERLLELLEEVARPGRLGG